MSPYAGHPFTGISALCDGQYEIGCLYQNNLRVSIELVNSTFVKFIWSESNIVLFDPCVHVWIGYCYSFYLKSPRITRSITCMWQWSSNGKTCSMQKCGPRVGGTHAQSMQCTHLEVYTSLKTAVSLFVWQLQCKQCTILQGVWLARLGIESLNSQETYLFFFIKMYMIITTHTRTAVYRTVMPTMTPAKTSLDTDSVSKYRYMSLWTCYRTVNNIILYSLLHTLHVWM